MVRGLIEDMKAAVDEQGEVHATIEEHDQELEIRRGQVTWRDQRSTLVIHTHTETRHIGYERVVDFYVPNGIWD